MRLARAKRTLIELLLGVPGGLEVQHHRTYYVMLIGNYVGLTLHCFFAWCFGWLGVTELFHYNIGSSVF